MTFEELGSIKMTFNHIRATIAGSIFLALGTSALAAPPSLDRTAANASDDHGVQAASVDTTGEDGPNCAKSRKRLWVEGEGWLVRKVTTCH